MKVFFVRDTLACFGKKFWLPHKVLREDTPWVRVIGLFLRGGFIGFKIDNSNPKGCPPLPTYGVSCAVYLRVNEMKHESSISTLFNDYSGLKISADSLNCRTQLSARCRCLRESEKRKKKKIIMISLLQLSTPVNVIIDNPPALIFVARPIGRVCAR